MQLKVCGVRTPSMLQSCQDLSVPYIGLNFVSHSKRIVDIETAHQLSHSFTGKKVGIFQNHSIEVIVETLSMVDLDIIQLHGQEGQAFVNHLHATLTPSTLIWKALDLDDFEAIHNLPEYGKNLDLILFDSKKPGSGTQISDLERLQAAVSRLEEHHINNFPKLACLIRPLGLKTKANFLKHS